MATAGLVSEAAAASRPRRALSSAALAAARALSIGDAETGGAPAAEEPRTDGAADGAAGLSATPAAGDFALGVPGLAAAPRATGGAEADAPCSNIDEKLSVAPGRAAGGCVVPPGAAAVLPVSGVMDGDGVATTVGAGATSPAAPGSAESNTLVGAAAACRAESGDGVAGAPEPPPCAAVSFEPLALASASG